MWWEEFNLNFRAPRELPIQVRFGHEARISGQYRLEWVAAMRDMWSTRKASNWEFRGYRAVQSAKSLLAIN